MNTILPFVTGGDRKLTDIANNAMKNTVLKHKDSSSTKIMSSFIHEYDELLVESSYGADANIICDNQAIGILGNQGMTDLDAG